MLLREKQMVGLRICRIPLGVMKTLTAKSRSHKSKPRLAEITINLFISKLGGA